MMKQFCLSNPNETVPERAIVCLAPTQTTPKICLEIDIHYVLTTIVIRVLLKTTLVETHLHSTLCLPIKCLMDLGCLSPESKEYHPGTIALKPH